MNTCVGTRTGYLPPTFDPETLELVGLAEVLTAQTEGTSSFDGRGNWNFEGRAAALSDQVEPGDSPVGPPLEFECRGRYTAAPDRSFRIDGSCTSGPFEISGFGITGRVSRDRQTLILHDLEPTIETVAIGGIVVVERVCVAMATDVKLVGRP